MKKILVILFSLILSQLLAVMANPEIIHFTQSDGTTLDLIQKGDEFVHWSETLDGYTVLNDGNNIYFYAMLDNRGEMGRSGIQAHNLNQRSGAEINFLRTAEKKYHFSKSQINLFKETILMYTNRNSRDFPTTGTNNLLMILANFNDTSTTYLQSDFDNYMNQVNYNSTGSFKDFYLECSYGQLIINTTVTSWVTVPNTHDYYGPQSNWGDFAYHSVQAADASVDYSLYDNDSDGTVDGIAIIHQGPGQETTSNTNDIWSHSWDLASAGYSSAQRTFDGVLVSSYTAQPETNSYGGMGTIGVMCHEFGHNLGAPDFYDTNYGTGGYYSGMGSWCVMAGGSWNGSGGDQPAHHNAFTKWYYYSWCTPTLLASGADISMSNSVENSTDFYYYTTATSDEYFLLENRQQTGFDSGLPGHGLLVLHVDQDYVDLHDDSNDINANSHQGLYPKAANGIINNASCPFPGTTSNTSFTDTTNPNSQSWASANTNKPITNIQESAGVISFAFMGGIPEIVDPPENLLVDNLGNATWNAPSGGDIHEFRYDDGIITGQLGFGANPNSVMGGSYPNNAILDEVTWYLTSNSIHTEAIIYVFGLQPDGTPDVDQLLHESALLPNVDDAWNTYTLATPITAPDGFFIGVCTPGLFTAIGTDDGVDAPWEFQLETQWGIDDWTLGNAWLDVGPAGFPFNFSIRAYGTDNGILDLAPRNDTYVNYENSGLRYSALNSPVNTNASLNRDLLGYNVYLDGVFVEFTSDLFYQYEGLVNGTEYLAEVTADYDENESAPAEYMFTYISPIIADFDASPLTGIQPLEVLFTDISTGNPTSWEWDFDNDGTIESNEQNPLFTYSSAGLYSVTLTVSDGTYSGTETKEDYITVGEPIIVDFEAEITEGLLPLDVQFTDLSVGGLPGLMRESSTLKKSKIMDNVDSRDIVSWEWDFDNDGTIDSNEQNPLFTYTEAGLFTVSLTVSDGTNTGTETKVDYITVEPGTSAGDVLISKSNLYNCYPNPFNPTTIIKFDIKENESGTLSIYNIKGQSVLQKEFESGAYQYLWDASKHSSGIYLYRLQTDSIREMKKMIMLK